MLERTLLSLHRANDDGYCQQCVGLEHPCPTVTLVTEAQQLRLWGIELPGAADS